MPVEQEPDPTPAGEIATQPPPEEAFRLLIEAVQDYAIFLLGPDGRVRTWNPGAERAKGYAASEIIGQHFSVFYTPQEREAGRPRVLLGMAAAEGRVEDEGWRVRKDGTRFWADVILTALRDADGALYGFAKITRDLTERRRAEEQQRDLIVEQRARAAAEGALKVRDRFLSVASHELKTPVATLQLSAESLLRARELGRLDDARLETGLGRILKSTGRLGALVSELLDVSLLSAEGDQTVRRQATDIVSLVHEVTARFADALENESRIAVHAPARAVVEADASRLDQVFTNLIDNALKYSPDGEPIEIRVTDEPESVTVTVADRGIGLDAATEARLFDAFSRGDNATHVPGLGLGLFITHQIIERHGGRIDGRRAPGGVGSVFRVSLPKTAP